MKFLVKDRGTIWSSTPMRVILRAEAPEEKMLLELLWRRFPKDKESIHGLTTEMVSLEENDEEMELTFTVKPYHTIY